MIIYGMQASSLAEDIDVPLEEAEAMLSRYFSRFSDLKVWLDSTANKAKLEKRVRLPTGRVVFIGESNAKGNSDTNTITRKATNGMIQGVGAEITKLALKYLLELVDKHNLVPLAVVHDEWNVLIPGEYKVVSSAIDESGYTKYKYEVSPSVKEVSLLIQAAMLKAESDILSPLVGEDFPCGVDYNLGPYWIH